MTLRSLLNTACDIQTARPSADPETGQLLSGWETAAQNVPCRLRWRSEAERQTGREQYVLSDYVLYILYRELDPARTRVVIGPRLFKALDRADMGGALRYLAVYLQEIDGGY